MSVFVFRQPPKGVELPAAWRVPPHEYPDDDHPVVDGAAILRDWGTTPSVMSTDGLAYWTAKGGKRADYGARTELAILDDPRVGKNDRLNRDNRLRATLGRSCKRVTGFGLYYAGVTPGPVLYRGAREAHRNLKTALKQTGGDSAGIAWIPPVSYIRRGGYGYTWATDLHMLVGMARDYGCEGLMLWTWRDLDPEHWDQTIAAVEAMWGEA